jgi:hypothetical protein
VFCLLKAVFEKSEGLAANCPTRRTVRPENQ